MQRSRPTAAGAVCQCGQPIDPNHYAAYQTPLGWTYLCVACADLRHAAELAERRALRGTRPVPRAQAERDRLAAIEHRYQSDGDFRKHRDNES